MKKILRRLKLQYLPRTAMLLWGVSIFMIIVLIGVSFLPFSDLFTIRIFPLLIIMLLTENFLESQVTGSSSEAQQLTIETLILAILCSVVIGLEPVQQFVLLQPELTLFSVAALNMIVGRYTGLRLLEWMRFRDIINK
jgi:galactitol-specific phosphotransferase system IIC component